MAMGQPLLLLRRRRCRFPPAALPACRRAASPATGRPFSARGRGTGAAVGRWPASRRNATGSGRSGAGRREAGIGKQRGRGSRRGRPVAPRHRDRPRAASSNLRSSNLRSPFGEHPPSEVLPASKSAGEPDTRPGSASATGGAGGGRRQPKGPQRGTWPPSLRPAHVCHVCPDHEVVCPARTSDPPAHPPDPRIESNARYSARWSHVAALGPWAEHGGAGEVHGRRMQTHTSHVREAQVMSTVLDVVPTQGMGAGNAGGAWAPSQSTAPRRFHGLHGS